MGLYEAVEGVVESCGGTGSPSEGRTYETGKTSEDLRAVLVGWRKEVAQMGTGTEGRQTYESDRS